MNHTTGLSICLCNHWWESNMCYDNGWKPLKPESCLKSNSVFIFSIQFFEKKKYLNYQRFVLFWSANDHASVGSTKVRKNAENFIDDGDKSGDCKLKSFNDQSNMACYVAEAETIFWDLSRLFLKVLPPLPLGRGGFGLFGINAKNAFSKFFAFKAFSFSKIFILSSSEIDIHFAVMWSHVTQHNDWIWGEIHFWISQSSSSLIPKDHYRLWENNPKKTWRTLRGIFLQKNW